MAKSFTDLRKEFKAFYYNGYEIVKRNDSVVMRFDFSIDDFVTFRPETTIMTDNLHIMNAIDSEMGRNLVFSIGLAEIISYWKAICPPKIVIRCGRLSDEQKEWWKKLWFNGLGEFFYKNGISESIDTFVTVENDFPTACSGEKEKFVSSKMCLVPVGGGKDSAVTLSLLGEIKDKIMCFTVNDQQARTDTAAAAGIGSGRILRTLRTIDRELLRLNSEGFLNGHTPFSSVVAFIGIYCAYLIGAEHIVLSNESSANEASVGGTDINHQYSKSYEFERDFSDYTEKYLQVPIKYFSLLRPFCELQIAKKFASLPQFFHIFKSCNVGSKKNIWCCNCAKCLFVYIILSPFLPERELAAIFGCNMLDKKEQQADFDGLIGVSAVKPFECIGTVSEVNFALQQTAKKYESRELMPYLLRRYADFSLPECGGDPLAKFNCEHSIPDDFIKYAREMHSYVAAAN